MINGLGPAWFLLLYVIDVSSPIVSIYLLLFVLASNKTNKKKKTKTKQQQKQQRKVDKRKQSTQTKKIKCRTSAMIGQLPTFFQYNGNSKPGISFWAPLQHALANYILETNKPGWILIKIKCTEKKGRKEEKKH